MPGKRLNNLTIERKKSEELKRNQTKLKINFQVMSQKDYIFQYGFIIILILPKLK